jgi:hypothetical protein
MPTAPAYGLTPTFKQYLVGPIFLAVIAVGIVAADPATLSHSKKKNRTRYGFLLKMARARRKNSKHVDGTAMARQTSTIVCATEQ